MKFWLILLVVSALRLAVAGEDPKPGAAPCFYRALALHHELRKGSDREIIDQILLSVPGTPRILDVVMEGKPAFTSGSSAPKTQFLDRLDITKTQELLRLTRLEAMEVQALLRRFTNFESDAVLRKAVEMVKAGRNASNSDHKKLEKAPFIVALDVDNTVLDQDSNRYFVRGVHQSKVKLEDGSWSLVAPAPGIEKLIDAVRSEGGSVILYSRNSDDLIDAVTHSVVLPSGERLIDKVDGVFSSGHMVQPDGWTFDPRKLHHSLRKDLSAFGLDKTIIVDDNEKYILHLNRTRVVKGFSLPERGYSRWGDGELPSYRRDEVERHLAEIGKQNEDVAKEVSSAAAISRTYGIPFANAYYPFTAEGKEYASILAGTHPESRLHRGVTFSLEQAAAMLARDKDKTIAYINAYKRPRKKRGPF